MQSADTEELMRLECFFMQRRAAVEKLDSKSAVSWLFFGGSSLSISMRNLLREQGTGFGESMTWNLFFHGQDREQNSPNSSPNCAPQGLQIRLGAPLYSIENKGTPTLTRRLLTEGLWVPAEVRQRNGTAWGGRRPW